MHWPEAGQRLFPSPHRAEPENLRQNIIDELADHLALAAEDEVVKHGRTHEGAWQRAIERFGNPDAVARKLWWDAMKERVMRDWIHSGIAAVSAIVVVLVAVLVVNSMKQMQVTQVQLIEALKGLSQPPAPVGETLDVEVRRGTETGSPVAGAEVELSGFLNGENKASVKLKTDAEGHARFSPLPQGQYNITVSDPKSGMAADINHSILAGVGNSLKVVAPNYEPVPVKCKLDRPIPFPNDRVLARARIRISDRIAGLVWESRRSVWVGNEGCYELPDTSYHSSNDISMDLKFAGPFPTVLLPPGKVGIEPVRDDVSLFFRFPDGGGIITSSDDRGRGSTPNYAPLEHSGDTLTLRVTDEQLESAAKWVQRYTLETNWPDAKEINKLYWQSFDWYLLDAIPLADSLTASVNETDGKATLTVQPNLVKDEVEMVGGPNAAAVFKFPDLSQDQNNYPAGSRFVFACSGVGSGQMKTWTGSEWNAEVGAAFNVSLQPNVSQMDGSGLYDMTDFVKNTLGAPSTDSTAAGILIQSLETGTGNMLSLESGTIAFMELEGIVKRSGSKLEFFLPHLLVVSDSPPADL